MGTRWHPAMRLALAEAETAAAHGDVPIGAVVLGPGGDVIARAGNERELLGDPTAHLVADQGADHGAVLAGARRVLHDRYGIAHATLQVEGAGSDGCHDLSW